jgi:hypothetical protein
MAALLTSGFQLAGTQGKLQVYTRHRSVLHVVVCKTTR